MLVKQREQEKQERDGSDQTSHPSNEESKEKEVKFADIFVVNEDQFDSSDDDEEKKKNVRLENLGRSIRKMIKDQNLNQLDLMKSLDQTAEVNTEINIGQNGDIINRYRIPLDNNEVDINLKLPDDSDSSQSSNHSQGSPEK